MGKRRVVCYMPTWSQCQVVSEPAQERARAQGGLLYLLWPRTKDQEQASPHYPQTGLSDCSGHTTYVTHTHSLTCAFNPNHLSHKTMTNSLHDALIEQIPLYQPRISQFQARPLKGFRLSQLLDQRRLFLVLSS